MNAECNREGSERSLEINKFKISWGKACEVELDSR